MRGGARRSHVTNEPPTFEKLSERARGARLNGLWRPVSISLKDSIKSCKFYVSAWGNAHLAFVCMCVCVCVCVCQQNYTTPSARAVNHPFVRASSAFGVPGKR